MSDEFDLWTSVLNLGFYIVAYVVLHLGHGWWRGGKSFGEVIRLGFPRSKFEWFSMVVGVSAVVILLWLFPGLSYPGPF